MGEVITFYSYKGGVGRTMALANVAILLAQWGYKTLIVDWDLEAPGLEIFFRDDVDDFDLEQARQGEGIIDLLDCISNDVEPPSWREFLVEIEWPGSRQSLHLLTAGKQNEDYFGKVGSLDFDELYRDKRGGFFIEEMRKEWKQAYDYVLVDSRTGITDIGGVCTIQLPDMLVLFLTATEQNLEGVIEIVRKVRTAHQKLPFDRPTLLFLPILSRFDSGEEVEEGEVWLDRLSQKLVEMYADWLPALDESQKLAEVARAFLVMTKIPYMSYYSFGEKLAVLRQGTVDPAGLGYAYETLAVLVVNKLGSAEQLLESRSEFMKVVTKPSSMFKDLEIHIFPREAGPATGESAGESAEGKTRYSVRLRLGGELEFPPGHLTVDALSWVSSGDPAADGQRLFDMLFADPKLRDAWAEARGRAPQRRIRLWIDEAAPELHALPWELLQDKGVLLSAYADTPFSRYLPSDTPWGGSVQERPIRVLGVISNPLDLDAYNLAQLDVGTEQGLLRGALGGLEGRIQIEFLESPVTLRSLAERLREGYHVLHYVGHGTFSRRGQQAALYLQDEVGNACAVTADDISGVLKRQAEQDRPRLVFLAACQSAAGSATDAFSGLGQQLVAAGAPAVVAMQEAVAIQTARELSQAFYTRLLEHGLVDLALNQARDVLVMGNRPDAAVPVLFMRLKDGRLFAEESIEGRKKQAVSVQEIESPYGTMRPDSRFYIERAADGECWACLSKPYATTFFIQAPRQMGKSSLMRRMIDRAEKELNKRAVFIDFQEFPKQYFTDTDDKDFLVELCLRIGRALGIDEAINRYWQGLDTNLVKCGLYLSEYILPRVNEPFILAMDEVGRMLDSLFRADFFGMLRAWHNKRAYDESFEKISLFLSSSTEPFLLIDDPKQSPFNVAETILLQDFTKAEVEELNRRHQSLLNDDQIGDLMALVGGHPFLTRLAFYKLATSKITLDALLAQATDDDGPFGGYLRRYLLKVLQNPELKQALAQICRTHTYEENEIFYRLKEVGLIKRDGKQIVLRNGLYARYFEERLGRWPG